jgi:hypothetical protein
VIHKISTTVGLGVPKIASDIASRQFLAEENYRAKPYPGRVYLFKSESRPEFFGDDPDLGWGKILLDLRIEAVTGDHQTIHIGTNLKILARKLAEFLEDSPQRQGAGTAAAARHATVGGANSLPQSG